MKESTNAELRKKIEEDIGGLRAEIRQCLGSIMGSQDTIMERIDKLRDTQNHLIDMVNHHEKEIDNLQMKLEPLKTKIPTEYKWIGFLCKFKDRQDQNWQHYDILEAVDYANTDGIFEDRIGNHWQVCEIVHLTDKEVYKVKAEDLSPLSKKELDLLEKEFKLKSGF